MTVHLAVLVYVTPGDPYPEKDYTVAKSDHRAEEWLQYMTKSLKEEGKVIIASGKHEMFSEEHDEPKCETCQGTGIHDEPSTHNQPCLDCRREEHILFRERYFGQCSACGKMGHVAKDHKELKSQSPHQFKKTSPFTK